MKQLNRRNFLKTAACGTAAIAGLLKADDVAITMANLFVKKNTIRKVNKPWSLVILPDTQVYAMDYPGLFHLQTQWILENKDKYNIIYVIQNGDITNNNVEIQWQRASQAFDRIDGKVPYAIALGNHDFGPDGGTKDRSTLANNYFRVSELEKWSTFGGSMEIGKIDNTFHTFKVAGRNYLILCLEFGPRNEVLEWANKIIKERSGHKTIVVTHAYLYSDSTRYDWQAKENEQKWNPHKYPIGESNDTTVNDGQEMWNKLIRKHSNIFMVISGHVLNDGLGYLPSRGDNGNTVHQILVNFQMLPIGGGAWLRILQFQTDGKTIMVKDYSPLYETFNTNPDNQFTITL